MALDKFGRYFNLTDNNLKQICPTIPLTVDGNYDMEGRILSNLGKPHASKDAIPKSYLDSNAILLNWEGLYDAKNKIITQVGLPKFLTDAVNVKYLQEICLIISENNTFNARFRQISNVLDPIDGNDVTTKNYLEKSAITLNETNHYDCKRKRLTNIQIPIENTDAVTLLYFNENTITQTIDGHYDCRGKRLRYVGNPIDVSDVTTKEYVDLKTPIHYDDHWSFLNKRISNVANPFYDGEVVNLQTMKMIALCTSPKLKYNFEASNKRIMNVGNCSEIYDAVNLNHLNNEFKALNTTFQQQMRKFGSALFHYIHKSHSRTSDTDINEYNYVDWETIFSENSNT